MAARPRVLVVGPTPPPYHGGSVLIGNLLGSTVDERFELIHLDTSDRRDLSNLGALDLRNVWLACVHGIRFLKALARARPAVVYVPVAQNLLGFLRDCLFLLPARLAGARVVAHMNGGHCAFYAESGAAVRRLARLGLGGARVLVLGERLRRQLEGVVPADRVTVVPYGVPDPVDGVPAAARPMGGGEASPAGTREGRRTRVLYLGTLYRSKGFIDVLAAAELLSRRRTDVEFVVAGGYGTAADRRAAAPHLEALGDRVRMLGVVAGEAKARALADADVFVFPSHYRFEGQPLVVLEAMAAGLPVVSTDHGVIAETVVDGETGLLVPARDPAALAETLERLLDDPKLRQRLGRAGRARYLERYTLPHWAERMEAAFREALAAP